MPPVGVVTAKSAAVTVAYALAGWALCAATMGVGMRVTSLENALSVHAVAAPVLFAALSYFYYRRQTSWPPVYAATAFLGVVMFMDVFVVALLIERSFAMFESVLGTWLPFLLIFVSSWWTGLAVRRTNHRAAA
jgi:hypothetical protein